MSEKGQGNDGDAPTDPVRVDPGLALDEAGNEVTVEVRSDFSLDSGGQPVDANAAGLAPSPAGSSTPGGQPHASAEGNPEAES